MIKNILLFFLFLQLPLWGQADTINFSLEPLSDEFYEDASDVESESQIYDFYENAAHNPEEINEAGFYDLMKIPFMDMNIARSILAYRKNFGHIFSYRELYSIQNIDTTALKLIIPFISVNYVKDNGSKIYKPDTKLKIRSRFAQALQQSKGFIDNKHSGNRLKVYNKASISFDKNYTLNFVTEKDPGESAYNDFSSFNFTIKSIGLIKRLAIGDYLLEYGQGLALGGNAPNYVSSNAFYGIWKNGNTISSYTGTNENSFCRGGAVKISYNNFNMDIFYSDNKFDASIDTATRTIVSAPVSGLHRTVTEIANKQKGSVAMQGAMVDFSNNFIDVGVLYCKYKFNYPYLTCKNDFSPKEDFHIASLFYNISYQQLYFSGEASNDGNNVASMNSLYISANENISFLFSVRNYPNNYFSFYGNGYGKNSTNNEFGLYFGSKLKTEIGVFDFHFDSYKQIVTEKFDNFPSKGKEFIISFVGREFAQFGYNIRYINQSKEVATEGTTDMCTKQRLRLQINSFAVGRLNLKSTLLFSNYSLTNVKYNENGFAVMQEASYKSSYNLQIFAGVVFYSTDTYNTAIYQYEKDVPGSLTNTVLYGNGERFYVLINYSPFININLSLKYSDNFKPTAKTIGTGDNEIFTNTDNKLTFQMDFNF